MGRISIVFWILISATAQPVKVQGEYRNLAGYAYRISVPPGLSAYRPAAPAPNHGFVIDLAAADDAHIWVDGSYNAAFMPSARVAVERNLIWIEGKGDVIGRPRLRTTRLAGLPGAELLIEYRDRKTSTLRAFRAIAALKGGSSPDQPTGVVYEINLDTAASRIAQDEAVWRALVRSFQLLPQ